MNKSAKIGVLLGAIIGVCAGVFIIDLLDGIEVLIHRGRVVRGRQWDGTGVMISLAVIGGIVGGVVGSRFKDGK